MASFPETRLSLGVRDLEGGYEWPINVRGGEFFQIEFSGFLKIADGFLNRVSLAHGANFRAFRNV